MSSNPPEQRKLAAIMFTDMVGYSALTQRDERLALELLEEHRRLLRGLFPKFSGREVETTGDGFLVEFGSALEAAKCAIEIQRALATRNIAVPPDRQVQLRIGIHVGDVVQKEGHVLGDGVNIAARLQPLAEPGGICISVDVARQVQHNLEALTETRRALELDPLSALAIVNGSIPYALRGDKDRAVGEIRKALEIDPSYWYAHFALGWTELIRGNVSLAIAEYREANKAETFPFIFGWLGYAQAKGGQKEEARLALQRLDQLGRTRYVSPLCQAMIYLGLQDKEQTIARLEEAYLARSQMINMLKVDPVYDPLRSDGRFQALLKKVGLDH